MNKLQDKIGTADDNGYRESDLTTLTIRGVKAIDRPRTIAKSGKILLHALHAYLTVQSTCMNNLTLNFLLSTGTSLACNILRHRRTTSRQARQLVFDLQILPDDSLRGPAKMRSNCFSSLLSLVVLQDSHLLAYNIQEKHVSARFLPVYHLISATRRFCIAILRLSSYAVSPSNAREPKHSTHSPPLSPR